jgi:hypothetical protein
MDGRIKEVSAGGKHLEPPFSVGWLVNKEIFSSKDAGLSLRIVGILKKCWS